MEHSKNLYIFSFNPMKLFLLNLFKITAVFILLVITQFLLFKTLLAGNVSFEVSKKKSILILGDSQVETSFDDSVLDDCINFAKAGDPIFFNYIKLKKIIDNNTHIKTVVLGFSPSNLDSKGFYEVPKMKSKIITYFYLLDYNDYTDIIKFNKEGLVRGVTGVPKYAIKLKEIIKGVGIEKMKIGGFRPIPITVSELSEDVLLKDTISLSNPDPIAIKYFNEIVNFCESNGLNLIVINTPVHKSLSKRQIPRKKGYDKFFKELYPDVILWDYENLSMKDYYYFDNNHLNCHGAKVFSEFIGEKLNDFKRTSEKSSENKIIDENSSF